MIIALTLLACLPEPTPPLARGAISPAHGQGAVPVDLPLRVAGPFDHPEGHPLPDAVRVHHLDTLDPVDGSVTIEDGNLQFVPDSPWDADASYLWIVRQPLPVTRGPTLDLPASSIGEATFRTGQLASVLGATLRGDGAICVVLSQEPGGAELNGLRLSVDDVPAVVERVEVLTHEELDQEPRFEGDPGLGGVCMVVLDLPADPTAARFWLDARSWRYVLRDADPVDLVHELRRDP